MKRVYDMSFAEFQIRLFAWKRCQLREWERVRLLAWYTMAGSINAPKKMPSIEKFMPLGIDNKNKGNISEAQKARFLEEYSNYLKQVSNGRS